MIIRLVALIARGDWPVLREIHIERADLSGLDVEHHGYEQSFGLLHRRQMTLSYEGTAARRGRSS